MQNNKIGNVSVAFQDRKRTFKDKSSDLHTTMDFGSVVPGKVQRIYPNSKFSVGDSERIILTSLVAPCFGRISLKSYSYFVPFSDLTRNYAAMMAQEPVNRGSTSFVPQSLPRVKINDLSTAVLFGAQLTVYRYDTGSGEAMLDVLPASTPVDAPKTSLPTVMQTAISDLSLNTRSSSIAGLSSRWSFMLAKLIGNQSVQDDVVNFVGNVYPSTFFDARTNHTSATVPNMDPVGLEDGAHDYVVPVSVEYSSGQFRHYLLAFRLSSFGRRLRKILLACGWQFSLSTSKEMSILPLVAYYKAYFDVFGLTLYKNWEDTAAYSLLQLADLNSTYLFKFNSTMSDTDLFYRFIVTELGMTYYTESQDFVSAHTTKTGVSPSQNSLLSLIMTDISSVGYPRMTATQTNSSENTSFPGSWNGHAFINNELHGQLDSNLLKKLYRQTNSNTIAGRRIAELMKIQGLGSYMDEHKPDYIGSWEMDVPIYDLPAQSDTYNRVNSDGMHLGEFGAFGKGVGKHERVHFESKEDGYYINLLVIVPKGGYPETIDQDVLSLTKYQNYNPEFDSLGEEFDDKSIVLGSEPWSMTGFEAPTSSTGTLDDSFGLAPRYFNKKFGRNLISGDISLGSTKNSYCQWHLERLLSVNDHKVAFKNEANNVRTFNITRLNTPADLPVAGDVWRFITRYDWLAQFNRIFYNSFSTFSDMKDMGNGDRVAMFEYFSLRDDNFIVHMIYDFPVYDSMIPVQLSFETYDDENAPDGSIGKA